MAQITSMTGYGAGSAEGEGLRVRAVLRSVNGRFLDLSLRSPSALQEFEARLRERVAARLSRGKVSGTLEVEETAERPGLPELDAELAAHYVRELGRLAQIAGVEAVSLEALVRLPGLFRSGATAPDAERLGALALQALDGALDDLEQMQRAEGQTLVRDLRERLAAIAAATARIEALSAGTRDEVRRRLRDKVDALLQPGQVDADRLELEVVLVVERSDVTEEIVRLRSHLQQFGDSLDRGGEAGRRLNFLLQEMHREINTIASKSTDAEIIHLTVDVKEEVERLREQVQNLA